jgi:hypothetical protein
MLELFSRDGALWDEKGNRVQLRGVNYFGACVCRSNKHAAAAPTRRDAAAPAGNRRRASLATTTVDSSNNVWFGRSPAPNQPQNLKKKASKPPTLPRTACGPRNPC